MYSDRTPHLLVGLLLALTVFSASAASAVGAPAAEVEQTTNTTATNQTANESTADATVGNLTVWTGSTAVFGNLTSSAAVRAAMAEDRLTRDESIPDNTDVPWSTLADSNAVAVNDTVVFSVRAPGLTDAVLAANDTDSDTVAFLRLVNGSSTDRFRMEQTEATTRTMVDEKLLNLSATRATGGFRVAVDERNDTLYLALRMDRVVLDRGYSSDSSVDADEAYDVTVTADNRSSSTTIGIVRPPVSFHYDAGSTVRLGTGRRCAFVSGRVGPDESVTLDLTHPDSGEPIDRTRTTADASGQFGACFDTTGIPGNTTLRIEAEGYRGTAKAITGPYEEWGSVDVPGQNATNGTVTANASLSRSGFLALYRAPSGETGDPATTTGRCGLPRLDGRVADRTPIGVSDYLEWGSTDSVPIELTTTPNESTRVVAVVHFDRDDDGQFDYPGVDVPPCFNGTVPTDTATISPAGDSSTDSDGESGTVTAGPTTTTRPPTTTSHRDGPGFGPAVALSALLAVALLARRRR